MSDRSGGEVRSMTDEELALLKRKLELPDQVLEFLGSQPRLTMQSDAVIILVLMFSFSALAATLFVLPLGVWALSDVGKLLVDAGLLPQNTLLFDQGSGAMIAAIIIAGFGGIFLTVYLYHLLLRGNASLYYKSVASNLYPILHVRGHKGLKHEGPLRYFTRWLLRGTDKNLPPREYLKRYERRFSTVWACAALVLYLVAFALLAIDIKGIARVTPEGVALSEPFGTGTVSYTWLDVVGIGTGCSMTRRKGPGSYETNYLIRFSDKRLVDLGSYMPLHTTRLDALETVDRKLTALGIPKVQGNFDQGCMNMYRRRYGRDDFERLRQILQPVGA